MVGPTDLTALAVINSGGVNLPREGVYAAWDCVSFYSKTGDCSRVDDILRTHKKKQRNSSGQH
jgi:hypothetical protein